MLWAVFLSLRTATVNKTGVTLPSQGLYSHSRDRQYSNTYHLNCQAVISVTKEISKVGGECRALGGGHDHCRLCPRRWDLSRDTKKKGESHAQSWGVSLLGREESKCKWLEMWHSQNRKASSTKGSWRRERGGEKAQRGPVGQQGRVWIGFCIRWEANQGFEAEYHIIGFVLFF